MDDKRIDGMGHQASGAIKEGVGKMTDDPSKEMAGKIEKNAGKVERTVGEAQDDLRDAADCPGSSLGAGAMPALFHS